MIHPAVLSAVSAAIVLAILTAQFGWGAGATAGLLTVMSWSTGVLHERYRAGFPSPPECPSCGLPHCPLGDPD